MSTNCTLNFCRSEKRFNCHRRSPSLLGPKLIRNLTLITDALNPSLSNGAWETKRPELLKFSRLNLTRYFFDDAHAGVWDESAIARRGAILAEVMMGIWPDVERQATDTA